MGHAARPQLKSQGKEPGLFSNHLVEDIFSLLLGYRNYNQLTILLVSATYFVVVFVHLICHKLGRQTSCFQTFRLSRLITCRSRRESFVSRTGERDFPVAELLQRQESAGNLWPDTLTLKSLSRKAFLLYAPQTPGIFCGILCLSCLPREEMFKHKSFSLKYHNLPSFAPGDGQRVQTD